MQHAVADTATSLCPHQQCEDCDSLEISVMPERDANFASFAKLGIDDDVVWIENTVVENHQPFTLLARAGSPIQRFLRRAETPVRRADLLLQ